MTLYTEQCQVAQRRAAEAGQSGRAHLQLAKSIDAVSVTRDYITDWDRTEPRKQNAAA